MKSPLIFSFLIILLTLQYGYAIDELTQIQQAIKKKNAGWTAGLSMFYCI